MGAATTLVTAALRHSSLAASCDRGGGHSSSSVSLLSCEPRRLLGGPLSVHRMSPSHLLTGQTAADVGKPPDADRASAGGYRTRL